MAACLTAAGVDCGHEAAFTVDRGRFGGWLAESSWLAAPWSGMLRRQDVYVVHLVRDPLQVIRSNAERGMLGPPEPNRWGRYAIECCPWIAGGADRVERAARYWAAWNRLVDADETVRVEDVTASTVTRLARLVDPAAPGITVLPDRVNGQEAGLVGAAPPWDAVEGVDGLADLAARYGYQG